MAMRVFVQLVPLELRAELPTVERVVDRWTQYETHLLQMLV